MWDKAELVHSVERAAKGTAADRAMMVDDILELLDDDEFENDYSVKRVLLDFRVEVQRLTTQAPQRSSADNAEYDVLLKPVQGLLGTLLNLPGRGQHDEVSSETQVISDTEAESA